MNFFSSRRNQLNLEKFIQKAEYLNSHILNHKQRTNYEENNKKVYTPEESKFKIKQILKNYKLNRESQLNGFNKKYINILTDLLNEKNSENYSLKRLSLVNFRKKIINKKKIISFEDFMKKESIEENQKKLQTIDNSICLTKINKNLFNLKFINKNKYNSKSTKKIIQNNQELSSFDFFKKNNLKLNLEETNFSKNKKSNNFKSLSEMNSPINNLLTNRKNQLKTINSYLYKNSEEFEKYVWDSNPKEEFLKKNNKIKFIHYLNRKYNFYKSKSQREIKHLKEINKRQTLFYNKNVDLTKNAFPFKKEFFTKLNRLNLKKKNITFKKN